jgi:hypothetical protein
MVAEDMRDVGIECAWTNARSFDELPQASSLQVRRRGLHRRGDLSGTNLPEDNLASLEAKPPKLFRMP